MGNRYETNHDLSAPIAKSAELLLELLEQQEGTRTPNLILDKATRALMAAARERGYNLPTQDNNNLEEVPNLIRVGLFTFHRKMFIGTSPYRGDEFRLPKRTASLYIALLEHHGEVVPDQTLKWIGWGAGYPQDWIYTNQFSSIRKAFDPKGLARHHLRRDRNVPGYIFNG